MTFYYDDLDKHLSDFIEYAEVLYKKCGELKKIDDSPKSNQYDILENYFYELYNFLNINKSIINCNLLAITDISLSDNNVFTKK